MAEKFTFMNIATFYCNALHIFTGGSVEDVHRNLAQPSVFGLISNIISSTDRFCTYLKPEKLSQ